MLCETYLHMTNIFHLKFKLPGHSVFLFAVSGNPTSKSKIPTLLFS